MDPARIESYLRSTCSVLDFDIGEVWCARKLPGQGPLLRFIQLYTSPTYEDFHSLLIQPESNPDLNNDEEKHRFSPMICRSVCDGGHVVWANTKVSQGLTGRIDLPLNTAVGVPICSIGNDLYILVLFSVGLIPMTPQAVEYLTTVARAVTDGSEGFLSASFSNAISVSPAKTDDFVGIWDINELIHKYGQDVEFHVFPMGKLQKFFDCNEILLFCDLFMDFKLSRDGRFTVKQLESLRESFRPGRDRSDSIASHAWNIPTLETGNLTLQPENSTLTPENSTFPIVEEDFSTTTAAAVLMEIATDVGEGELASIGDNSAGHGVYSADLNSLEHEVDVDSHHTSPRELPAHGESDSYKGQRSILHIYAHMTYKLSQCRFHEFMIGILGTTVFEASELWLVNERKAELLLVAAVYRSSNMQKWIALSETLRLKIGTDVPGLVVETGHSHWDPNYSRQQHSSQGSSGSNHAEDHHNEPDIRIKAAQSYGVNMAFGVPISGIRGVCGAMVFYSSKVDFAAEPLLMLFIERAVQLMTTSSVESSFSSSLLVGNGANNNNYGSNSNDDATTAGEDAARSSSNARLREAQETHPLNRWRRSEDELASFGNKNNNDNNNAQPQRSTPSSSASASASFAFNNHNASYPSCSASSYRAANANNFNSSKHHSSALWAPRGSNHKPQNFDAKLEVVRGIVNNKHQPPYRGKYGALPSAQPSSSSGGAISVNDIASNHFGNYPPVRLQPQQAQLPMHAESSSPLTTRRSNRKRPLDGQQDQGQQELPPASPNEVDSVVNAAYTLATFSVSWKSFLAGSNNEMKTSPGYEPIKLDSQRVLSMYESHNADVNRSVDGFDPYAGLRGVMALNGLDRLNLGADPSNGAARGGGGSDGGRGGSSHHRRTAASSPSSAGGGEAGGLGLAGTLPKCKVEDCPYQVESATAQHCAQHRNSRRCQKEGCNKCAQGATKFCIAHGGGRRCTYPGCFKGARDKFFCAAHGGGKRCTYPDCTKSAVGGSNLCTAHGGGKRCQYPGCNKSSQSSTQFCVRHGGGKSCVFEGCTKVARGKTDYCAAHGGGVRCRIKGCNKLAVGMQQLCRTHGPQTSSSSGNPRASNGANDYEDDDDDDDDDINDEAIVFLTARQQQIASAKRVKKS